MYNNSGIRLKLSILLLVILETCLGFSVSHSTLGVTTQRNPLSNRPSSKCFSTTDDDFMAALRSRVEEVNDRATKLPLVVLDSMVPRQVLKAEVSNPLLMLLVRECLLKETPFFGMLGMARLADGQQIHLKYGVEVEILEGTKFVNDAVRLELRAGRRFCIDGEVDNAGQGWTEARVKFLDSEQQEMEEARGEDRMSVARAIMKGKEFTSPNMNMKDNKSLMDTWIQLAKENERKPGQIDELLDQLGDIPPSENPTERAFWIGALINPIPAMGVAVEVRPSLLTAKRTEARIEVALAAILRSIKHMDGSAPM
eukprot:CAMPEP_0198295342 /NCGR_PEP_ID=MMETSP1449-20131203/27337_1 /TAXON_ID=420275 /ORGANISM="Attheya septentrionalis, Strain CCMP2084" /LENGTH=311 /DNA_ID=CAMNT_0043995625 /DNA_START=156 /DNA_END=1091 /DNA_ORIENTATION=-